MSKNTVKQATELVTALCRLVFITLAGTILMIALLLVANLGLYVLARVVEVVFDLVKNGVFGG